MPNAAGHATIQVLYAQRSRLFSQCVLWQNHGHASGNQHAKPRAKQQQSWPWQMGYAEQQHTMSCRAEPAGSSAAAVGNTPMITMRSTSFMKCEHSSGSRDGGGSGGNNDRQQRQRRLPSNQCLLLAAGISSVS